MRWSGPHLQRLLPFSLPGKIRQKSMARGSALESQDERLVVSLQKPSPVPREREAALPCWCKPVVERASVKRTPLLKRSRLPRLPDRLSALSSARAMGRRKAVKGYRARRVSAVRRLLPPPVSVERKPVELGPIRLSWM